MAESGFLSLRCVAVIIVIGVCVSTQHAAFNAGAEDWEMWVVVLPWSHLNGHIAWTGYSELHCYFFVNQGLD